MMARRSTIFVWRIAVLSLAIFSGCLYAQEKPDSPEPQTTATAETPATATAETPATATAETPVTATAETPVITKAKDKEANDEVPKRIFWIIPNFMTANDQPQNLGPLTPKQKFNIAWHQWWDISAHIGNLVQASISQAANGIPEYGQGWAAFGKRYAAEEGDQFTGAMLIYGVLPSLLHDDPRYFRKGRGSTWYRIGYAASRTVICRTDSGKNTFNIPQVFGQLGQASISLTYYPQENRNIGGLFSGWAINQLYNMGWNQLKEFTPDLGAFVNRRYKKRHKAAEINDNRSPISPTN